MGIGDFLTKAGTSFLGGMGERMEYESSPEAKLARETQERNLRTDAIAASQEKRQVAQAKREEAKTISEIFTTGLAINNRGERNTYFESVGDKIGIDPKRLKSISLSRFSDEERQLVLKELDFLDTTEREELVDLIKKFIDSSSLDDAALSVEVDAIVQKAKKRKTERNIGEVRRGIIGEVLKTTEEPGTTPDIAPDSPQLTHRVRDGETLFSIARKYYGETGSEQWKMVNKIYEANNLSELGQGENTIYRGQELIIPDAPMPISGEGAGIGVDTGIEPEAPVEPTASEKIRIKRDKYNQEKERLDNQKKELLTLKKGYMNLRKSPERKRELELIKEALEFNQKEEEIRLTGVGLLDEREKAILENKLRQEEKQDNADLMDMKIRVRNIYAGGEPLKIIDVNGKPVLNKNGTERYENKVPMRTVKGELVRDSEGEILFFKDADDAGIAIEDELAKKRGESKRRIGKLSSKRTEFDYVQFDRDITNRIKDKQ
jgi:nucleoid-associated protein YgaU